MGARFLATLLLVACMPAGLAGQSLGELARKEQYWRERKARLENALRACEIEVAGIEGST